MSTMIAASGAQFSYGDTIIFSDLNVSVGSGEVLCLLGANGCGKTTFLRCLAGYLHLQAGNILLNGADIKHMAAGVVARRIAFVFQDNVAGFPYTVLEVVRMGRAPHLSFFASPGAEDTRIAERALENVGVAHLKDKRFTQISGGERQLVVIARALAQEAEVIIMDEPTSALDFKNQTLVLRLIRKLAAQGLTIVMSSHFPNNALLFSTRVALMHKGRFIAVGNPNEVIDEANLGEIYGMEVKMLSATEPGSGRPLHFVIPAADPMDSEQPTPNHAAAPVQRDVQASRTCSRSQEPGPAPCSSPD